MKKSLLLLWVLIACSQISLNAQTCVRDSSLLQNDSLFISPRPDSSLNQHYGLASACINHPYAQSVTIKVPPTFTFQGITLPIVSAQIATSGAVANLPAGVSYVCDPPNCVFSANSLGCILVTGTPNNPAQAPDTLDLAITATINSAFGPIPITFPGPIAPGHYYLALYAESNCVSDAYDVNTPVTSLKNSPNPFSGTTQINVATSQRGSYLFEVFDVVGRRVYFQPVDLEQGANTFTFDAGHLANGAYYYVISNPQGKASRLMIVNQ